MADDERDRNATGPDPADPAVDDDFSALYRQHYAPMVRLAGLILGSYQAGEEVAQDAFAKLLDPKRAVASPVAYLRAAVINASRSRVRRSVMARRRTAQGPEPAPGPDEGTDALATRLALRAALRGLSPRQREAVVLRYFSGLTDTEVAGAMGVSLGSAKTHLHRALAALATELEALR